MKARTATAPATHFHYFRKIDGAWTCSCGEQRDKAGREPKKRHLRVAGK